MLFTIEHAGPGRLCTMARPRGGDWLVDELRGLRQAGIDVLVSLLTDQEVAELGLGAEADAATAAGIGFHRPPTPDRHAPNRAATLNLATTVRQHSASSSTTSSGTADRRQTPSRHEGMR